MIKRLHLLFIIFILFCTGKVEATHIVGGELNYRYLGSNQYQISLTVYRDCYNGQVLFDDPAIIGIFDVNNNLLDSIVMTLNAVNPVPLKLITPCYGASAPNTICYEMTTYSATVTLPSRVGGYQLAYQRCCRNYTIQNIPNPGTVGATFYAKIPQMNVLGSESNPIFKNTPPNFTCVNFPFTYDMSATDLDGDSLVYLLDSPLDGADQNNPEPRPPYNPPYFTVNFQPPYSLANMLGGTPLTIDPRTGQMYAVPNTIGQFVVGVRVMQYRNGVYIGETLRQFQLNVTTCSKTVDVNMNVVADFTLPPDPYLNVGECGNKIVNFINLSTTPGLTYHWDFGVLNLTNDTSNLTTPAYTYPDTGTYHIKLIGILPDSLVSCQDTAEADIHINPELKAGFRVPNPNSCIGLIQFQDTTTGLANSGNTYFWQFGDGQTSNQSSPSHVYAPGNYTVTLTVTTPSGCNDGATFPLNVVYAAPVDAGPNRQMCLGGTVSIGTPLPGFTSTWSPASGLSSTTQNVVNASPSVTTKYYITSVNVNGCTGVDSVTVVVNNPPLVSAGSDQNICNGASYTVGTASNPDYTYQWSSTLGISFNTNFNSFALNGDIVYYLAVHSISTNCTGYDTVAIHTIPNPISDAGPDKTICPGDSIQIGVAEVTGFSYSWTPTGTLINPSQSDPTAHPSNTTKYFLRLTDNTTTCYSTDSMLVNVVVPTAYAGPDQTTCFGDSISIGIANPGNTVIWSPTTGMPHVNQAIVNVKPDVSTKYIITTTDIFGCVAKDSLFVTVDALPILNLGPDKPVCDGLTYTVSAPLNPDLTYSWTSNLGNSFNTNSQTFVMSQSETFYLVIQSQTSSCFNRDTISYIFTPNPIVDAGPDKTFCKGNFVAIGNPPSLGFSYFWTPNVNIDNQNVSSPVVHPDLTTKYYLKLTNDATTCFSIDSLTIHIVTPDFTAGKDSLICFGDTIQIGYPSNSNYSYSWNSSMALSDTSISNPKAFPNSNTTYTVTVVDNLTTCRMFDTLSIQVGKISAAGAGTNKVICNGQNIMIGAIPNNPSYNYLWSPALGLNNANISNPSANPVVTTKFLVSITDPVSGCQVEDSVVVTVNQLPLTVINGDKIICNGDSIQIGGNSQINCSYSWAPPTGLDFSNISNPFSKISTPLKYYLLITDNTTGCVKNDSLLVDVSLINEHLTNTFSLCLGDSVRLYPNPNNLYSYLWIPGTGLSSVTAANPLAMPGTTTTYSVTISQLLPSGKVCSEPDSVVVNVSKVKLAVNSGPDKTICFNGGTFNLFASSNSPNTNFAWHQVGIPGILNSNPKDSSIFINQQAGIPSFYVIANNDFCNSTDTVKFTTDDVRIQEIPDMSVCKNINPAVIAHSLGQGLNYDFYYFDQGHKKTLYQIYGVDATYNIPFTDSTHIFVTGSDGICTDTVAFDFKTIPAPPIWAEASKLHIYRGETVNLYVHAASPNYTYAWYPSNLVNPDSSAITFSNPNQPTTYIVTVSDQNGCTTTSQIYIDVTEITECKEPTIFVPNAFTPDGDGVNDVVYVRGSDVIKSVEMLIYNRWGELVTELHNPTDGWHGNFNGQPAEAGVYVYYLKVTCLLGEVYIKKGNITLIR